MIGFACPFGMAWSKMLQFHLAQTTPKGPVSAIHMPRRIYIWHCSVPSLARKHVLTIQAGSRSVEIPLRVAWCFCNANACRFDVND